MSTRQSELVNSLEAAAGTMRNILGGGGSGRGCGILNSNSGSRSRSSSPSPSHLSKGPVATQQRKSVSFSPEATSQAEAQAQSTAISAASQARNALHAYRRTWDIANAYSDQVLPIQEALNQEELLRYNGMLISVFDLLKNAKKSLQTQIRHIESLRDFWLADNQLRHTLVAAGSISMQFTSPSMASSGDGDDGGH